MTTEYRQWVFTDDERRKFDQWMDRIMVSHTGTTDIRNDTVNWTP